jgi:uncharacterized protein YgbK (DUF1537 family)
MNRFKIIVLDDDPTGSQTVHSCLLLTRWDTETLREALTDVSPLFFILTNTRSLDSQEAREVTRVVCRNLKLALKESRAIPIFASRSDSTLRGHYPIETDVMEEELGPFDAHFLVPAFIEAGRITRHSIHYQKVNHKDIPVHESEFARDPLFGYKNSFLPAYVEEKTEGRIRSQQVERFLLADLRRGCFNRLMGLAGNACCVVDAESQKDLDRFAADSLLAMEKGKRFLFRCAASLLTSLAHLPPQPILYDQMKYVVRDGKPGAIIVGSYVKKTGQQIEELLKLPGVIPMEVPVEKITSEREELFKRICLNVEQVHREGKTMVVYTSRVEKRFSDSQEQVSFGKKVSAFLVSIVQNLPNTLGFLISKGGITSNDVLSKGLQLRASRVLGQIYPGCSVVFIPSDHPRFPKMPVVIFPGNVGDDIALALVYQRLAGLPNAPLQG